EFNALESHLAHIHAVSFIGAGTPALNLTNAQATADAGLLAKITQAYVLNVNTNGTTTTTGHGNNLTIRDVPSHDLITATGSNWTFDVGAGFGLASVAGFSTDLSGATHDEIVLAKRDFASFSALVGDSKQVGTSVVVTASNNDQLTLDNLTLAALKGAGA